MKRLPLFFLLAVSLNAAQGADAPSTPNSQNRHSQTSATMRVSTDDRVNDYNKDLEAAIRNSKNRHKYDRMVAYTGYEEIFQKVEKPGDYRVPYGTGGGLISNLENFPAPCIPNLTILSHGWGSSRTSGGKGLPIAENSENGFPVTGFYTNEEARISEVQQSVNDYMNAHRDSLIKRFKEINGRDATEADMATVKQRTFDRYNETSKVNSATLADLSLKIKKRDVKFCERCLIQIYSCNLDSQFVSQFAQTTGCQIVYGTGKVSGSVTGRSADGSPDVTLTGYKSSDKREENGKVKYVNMNTRSGNFIRVTPLRDSRGKTYAVHEEGVGTPLVNKSGEAYGYTYKLFK